MPVLLSFQDGKLMFGRKAGCLTPRFTAEDGLPRPCCSDSFTNCNDPDYAFIRLPGFTPGDITTCDAYCWPTTGTEWDGVLRRVAGEPSDFAFSAATGSTPSLGDKPSCYWLACSGVDLVDGRLIDWIVMMEAYGRIYFAIECSFGVAYRASAAGDNPLAVLTKDTDCDGTGPSSIQFESGGSCP
jgi:hypothetical protein